MIRGRLDAQWQARALVNLRSADGEYEDFETVLDTGFSGHLTLPRAILLRLGWELEYQTNVVLANNVRGRLNTWNGQILWHGQRRSIPVLEADGAPLLGMRLLRDSQLTILVRIGGDVLIEELD